MAKTESKGPQKPGNVAEMGAQNCVAEGCKAKQTRAEFCGEHFQWFKEGLLTKKGERPKDFDKKYIAYQTRKHKTA